MSAECPESHLDWRDYKADYCPACGEYLHDDQPDDLWSLIEHLNRQFDYGEEGDDPEFWINMLESQAKEAREHNENGRGDKVNAEFADAVFVAVQGIMQSGADNREVVRERAEDILGRVEEIQPKYAHTNGHRVGFAPWGDA